MKLYIITGPNIPVLLFKAESAEEALKKFEKGLRSPIKGTVKEATIPYLMELIGDESLIIDECNF